MRDECYRSMTEFLVQLGTTDVEHTGKGFLAHLVGVYQDLERWDADVDVCRAGMFHSIYGTQLFQNFCLPLSRRGDVQDLIGERAEWLAFLNSVMDRPAWDRIFLEQTGERAVVNRLTGEKYLISQRDFDDLTTIHVCDWLEQVPRSQDWNYRRDAYQAMAEYLGGIAEEECARVYGLETVAG
jgi:hypothetical protein